MRYNHFAAQNRGGSMLSWRYGPPRQTRAADTLALGSLSEPTLVLPAPGAPEPLNFTQSPYCGCKGKKMIRVPANPLAGIPVVDDVADVVRPVLGSATTPVVAVGLAYVGYRLFKAFTK